MLLYLSLPLQCVATVYAIFTISVATDKVHFNVICDSIVVVPNAENMRSLYVKKELKNNLRSTQISGLKSKKLLKTMH